MTLVRGITVYVAAVVYTLTVFALFGAVVVLLLHVGAVAGPRPTKQAKEAYEEWLPRYLEWRRRARRQLIQTDVLLNPDADLEHVDPPLDEHQSLHRAAVLEGAVYGYVKSLTLVDHVLECATDSGKYLRKKCFDAGWVDDPDAKPPEPKPTPSHVPIEKLRAQCKEMGLSAESLVQIGAHTLEVVLDRYGAQCITCRKWRLREWVDIDEVREESGDGKVLKVYGIARCKQPYCGAILPPLNSVRAIDLVNKARAETAIESLEGAVLKTGGVPEIAIGPSAEMFLADPDEPLDDAIRNYAPPLPPMPEKQYSPGGLIKPIVDGMRMPQSWPKGHPGTCRCRACWERARSAGGRWV